MTVKSYESKFILTLFDYIYRIYYKYEDIKPLSNLLEQIMNNITENEFLNHRINYKDFNTEIIENKSTFKKEKNERKFLENKYNKVKVNTKGFKNNFRRR